MSLDQMEWRTRLHRTLEFAVEAIPVLTAPTSPWVRAPEAFRHEKFVCETALLLYAADAVAPRAGTTAALIGTLAASLDPHARSERIEMTLLLRPSMVRELTVAHGCLSHIGHPDDAFMRHIEPIARDTTWNIERAPWKDLESDWWSELLDVDPRSPETNPSLARTHFGTGLDVLAGRREDVYAFTHALIYLTDFGRRPSSGPRPVEDVVADAGSALARCIDDDDFDLAAEVLFTWAYLRVPFAASPAFALSVLAHVDDQVGFLPSLGIRTDALVGLTGEERRFAIFDEAYHTVYVMGLLAAALCLVPAADPGAISPRSGQARHGAAEAIRVLMPDRTPTPQWARCFDALPAERQDELAPFLVDIGLHRALRQNDLAALHRLVMTAMEIGLEPTTASHQACAMLGRVARRWSGPDA